MERQKSGIAVAARPWPKVTVTETWSGLHTPVGITSARDGTGRLYVCEKDGRIRLIDGGQLRAEPFLDIADRVSVRHTEQGLLSIAFPPHASAKGYFFACYTDEDNDIIVSRFRMTGTLGAHDSEERILVLWHPYRNHNGGQLQFGPDGYLYVSIGDGGSEYDPNHYGQNPGVGLAKILRIDTENVGGEHENGEACECTYHIPDDNPFADNPYFLAETWHWGLRNPWRFSFDRQTGDMYIGDVGQDMYEEIDFAPAGLGGLNFGWSIFEGSHRFPSGVEYKHTRAWRGEDDLVLPVAEYDHKEEGGIAVIGGCVYRGRRFPELAGIYLFADYGSGKLYGLRPTSDGGWEHEKLAETALAVTSFGEDDDGEVYLTDFRGGVHLVEA